MGRTGVLVLVGLVWAAWHMPLIFLTSLYHSAGTGDWCPSVGTIVTGGFAFGYLRLWAGSVWAPVNPHSADNPGLGRSEKGRTRRS